MTGREDARGDLRLVITGDLYRLTARILNTENEGGICWHLSRLSVEKLLRFERLATEQPDVAEAMLRKALATR
jgi:hypothetical protein